MLFFSTDQGYTIIDLGLFRHIAFRQVTFWHRNFGTIDVLANVLFGPTDILAHERFGMGVFWCCGHFDMGTLRHWDILELRRFSRDISAQWTFIHGDIKAQFSTSVLVKERP